MDSLFGVGCLRLIVWAPSCPLRRRSEHWGFSGLMWRHGCSCIYIESLSADVEVANVYTCKCLPRAKISDSMMAMSRQITKVTNGSMLGRLSPWVSNRLRMVTRVLTQR